VLAPHADIDFAAPKGANPPVDQSSITVRTFGILSTIVGLLPLVYY